MGYELEIFLYYRAPGGTGFHILAFGQGGILSQPDYYGSKKAVEKTVDDLVLIAINEILKARKNNRWRGASARIQAMLLCTHEAVHSAHLSVVTRKGRPAVTCCQCNV